MNATITPAELGTLLRKDPAIDLIDVRTPAEFEEVHLSAARNVPLDRLDPKALLASRAPGSGNAEPLYVICRSGSRGKQACEAFAKAGFAGAVNVEGGTLACVDAGLPAVRGRKTISLERQVRICAGALVLGGALLSWFVHPAYVALSGFVGAGLIFAGITDTCGMGVMLARMPWNQAAANTNAAGSCPVRTN
ncbi:MAG: rhodanese-like domain-containing protein [Planctomycetota bacterium]|nr:rhodanese-like domain-containing protein [Planctomycetota bacterium]